MSKVGIEQSSAWYKAKRKGDLEFLEKFDKVNKPHLLPDRGLYPKPSNEQKIQSNIRYLRNIVCGHNSVVFDTSPGPENARLKIFNVSESDDGIYRCRVDFKASQTRTSRLNLTVVGK